MSQKPDIEAHMKRLAVFFSNLNQPLIELYDGIATGTFPWLPCLAATVVLQFSILTGLDHWLITQFLSPSLYPTQTTTFHLYYMCYVSSPFWAWAWIQVGRKRRLTRRLTEIFQASGLRNNLGHLPNFVFDRPLDASIRKLRLTRAVLDMTAFERAKNALEGGLQIYIDEFKENRTHGTIDIIYSSEPMPKVFKLVNVKSIGRSRFLIGTTRSKELKGHLDSVPHLLVAGQTGGGKSTFLRQFITSQYLNDKFASFTLIDLKGGMEFQLFEHLPRVSVPQSMDSAMYDIKKAKTEIDRRMGVLKSLKCKDLSQLQKLSKEERKGQYINRHFIVVDEAAEMFLAGHHASGNEVQAAKKVLSQIARQGRAIGIHLVVATQRPDSRALDPQIKANLSGALCFQMANDISSITVLGNGRATDLPPVPGRAIWKTGTEMTEVQTPLLDVQEAETLLKPFYKEDTNGDESGTTDPKEATDDTEEGPLG